MSKKRGRAKQQKSVQAAPGTGVPAEELLAEGSGPAAAAEIDASGEQPVIVGMSEGEDDRVEAGGDAGPTGEHVDEQLAAATVATEPDAAAVDVDAMAADAAEAADPSDAEALETAAADDDPSAVDPVDVTSDTALAVAAEGEAGEGAELALDGAEDDLEVAEGEAVLPTSAASMDPSQLKQLVEALVFASDKPLTVQRLRQLTRVSDTQRLEAVLSELASDYQERGLVLQQVSGGYQFRTRSQFSVWVQQLIAGRPVRLSRAQLETLAIVAYRQPITRPEIDDIRGVDSSATLKLLMDRLLIRVLGKKEEVGRPMLYGTTKEFLDFFSLGDLRELPTLREYSELSDESRRVMSNRLGVPLDDGGDGSGSGGEPGGDGGSDGGDGGAGGTGGDDGGSDPGGGMPGGGGDLGDDGDIGDVGQTSALGADAGSLSDLASRVLAADARGLANDRVVEGADADADELVELADTGSDAARNDASALEDDSTDGPALEAQSLDASDAEGLDADAADAADAESLEAQALGADGVDGDALGAHGVDADAGDAADAESLEAQALGSEEVDGDALGAHGVDADAGDADALEAQPPDADGLDADVLAVGVDGLAADASDAIVASADGDEPGNRASRDLDQGTDSVAFADAADLEPSQTRAVDPLIAAEALSHAETITTGASGESSE